MRPSFLLSAVLLSSVVFAADLAIKGLTVPEVDAENRLTRRLHAEAATGPIESPKLTNGYVEFFKKKTSAEQPIAILKFQEAIYPRVENIVYGEKHAHLTSPKGDLSGDGFVYHMKENRLLLKSNVVIDLPKAHVTGREAEALLSPAQEPSEEDVTVTWATVKGGVVVTDIKSPKYTFDRAESEAAVYTASDEMLTLASPVTVWRKGEKSAISAPEFKIYVGKNQPAPDAPPAATAP